MKPTPSMTLAAPAPRPWLARLLGWMTRPAPRDGLIRPEIMTRPMLRDIGLAEDARANHLLGDAWLRR